MVSHTDDGLGDARVVYVPAMDHKPGTMRPVFYDTAALGHATQWGSSERHRLITDTRGPGYDIKGEPKSIPLGFIPQVPHTYAYIDANYGVMNEHQLSIGECTDKAKVHPERAGQTHLLLVRALPGPLERAARPRARPSGSWAT